MNRQKLIDRYLEDDIRKGLDEQIRIALDEIKAHSKQIGDLESLDKTDFPVAENTISFLKLTIKLRQDAIKKWASQINTGDKN